MTAIDAIVEANRQFAQRTPPVRPGPPARHVVVVTCMDARLDVLTGLGLALGDAHFLRNAGGLVTDDVLRSLVISQTFLATTEVAVIHHTKCGMIGLDDAALRYELETAQGSAPPWDVPGIVDLPDSVSQSVRRVRDCPWLPHRDAVRGFVYDVDSGALAEVAVPS